MSSRLQHRIEYPDTAEVIGVLLKLAVAPNGSPTFQLVPDIDIGDTPTLGSWVTGGSYTTTYNTARREIWAATPLVGAGQALDIEAGGRSRLLCKPDLGSGREPIIDCGRVVVAGSDAIIGA